MKDQLISFETAKLAKEKGFDCKTQHRYQGDKDTIVGGSLYNHNNDEEQSLWNITLLSAPTQSLLQKWLREVYEIHLLNSFEYNKHVFRVVRNIAFSSPIDAKEYKTYEEALEDGLQEALKLIN